MKERSFKEKRKKGGTLSNASDRLISKGTLNLLTLTCWNMPDGTVYFQCPHSHHTVATLCHMKLNLISFVVCVGIFSLIFNINCYKISNYLTTIDKRHPSAHQPGPSASLCQTRKGCVLFISLQTKFPLRRQQYT